MSSSPQQDAADQSSTNEPKSEQESRPWLLGENMVEAINIGSQPSPNSGIGNQSNLGSSVGAGIIYILLLAGLRYDVARIIRGSIGERIGVIASLVIGVGLMISAPTMSASPDYRLLIGLLTVIFGGLVLGNLGRLLEYLIRKQHRQPQALPME
jgi:hypothetical protein